MFLGQIYNILHYISFIGCMMSCFVEAQAQHSSWVNRNMRPDPRWQLFREQPLNYLAYAKYYQIPTAGPLPVLPPSPQRQTATPEIVQRQRNEGNFYRATTTPTATSAKSKTTTNAPTKKPSNKKILNGRKSRLLSRNAGYAAFEHKVVHVTVRPPNKDARSRDYLKRRSFQPKAGKSEVNSQREPEPKNYTEDLTTESSTILQQKHFHDIFMHYAGPQSVAFGHMEKQPGKLTQRFESLNKGNRYRGEVTWHDALTGGYGTQHWDLAQGSLRRNDHHKPSEKFSSIDNQ